MHLKDPAAAKIVEDAILFGADERYDLFAWCVMSNHVHVLLTPRFRGAEEAGFEKSQAGKPDVPLSQARKPDVPLSQARKPDVPLSQARKPDVPLSQARKPDVPLSQARKPDVPLSQARKPDVPLSQARKPDVPLSQARKPDVPLSQARKPDVPLSQARKPDVPLSQARKPDVRDWGLPNITMGIKGYTAYRINELQGERGRVLGWMNPMTTGCAMRPK